MKTLLVLLLLTTTCIVGGGPLWLSLVLATATIGVGIFCLVNGGMNFMLVISGDDDAATSADAEIAALFISGASSIKKTVLLGVAIIISISVEVVFTCSDAASNALTKIADLLGRWGWTSGQQLCQRWADSLDGIDWDDD